MSPQMIIKFSYCEQFKLQHFLKFSLKIAMYFATFLLLVFLACKLMLKVFRDVNFQVNFPSRASQQKKIEDVGVFGKSLLQ